MKQGFFICQSLNRDISFRIGSSSFRIVSAISFFAFQTMARRAEKIEIIAIKTDNAFTLNEITVSGFINSLFNSKFSVTDLV